jgi:hypothetical protein
MYHLQAEVFALNLPYHLPSLLAVHVEPMARRWAAGCVLGFLLLLVLKANSKALKVFGSCTVRAQSRNAKVQSEWSNQEVLDAYNKLCYITEDRYVRRS